MKKILLVMPFFYPHKAGSQKYAEELYAHLLERYPGQFKVDVLVYNTDKVVAKERYRGMQIYRIPCWHIIEGRFSLPCPFSLLKKLWQLSKEKYDFVNSHLVFFDPCWWVWFYARLIGARSIFTEHVASYPVHQNKIVQWTAKVVDKTIGRFSLRFYDFLTVTNKAAERFLKKELGIKKKINLVYGGVDTKYFSPSPVGKKRIIPVINKRLSEDDLLITYVGRLIWTKGVSYLYQAVVSIIDQLPKNTYFVLVGGGELEKELGEKIQQDGLARRVFLTGFIPYQKVRDILSISDVFINPSHHNEGFPNTILEAGASGDFVIATDNACTKEVIIDKETGLLIPQKDLKAIKKSILWAVTHSGRRREIAKNLHSLIKKKFDWSMSVQKFAGLLKG